MKIVILQYHLFALTTIFVGIINFGMSTSVASKNEGKMKNNQFATSNFPKMIKPLIGDTNASFENLRLLAGKDFFQKQFSNENEGYETITTSVVKNGDGFDVIPKSPHTGNGEVLITPSFYQHKNTGMEQVISEPIEKTFSTPIKLNNPTQEAIIELPTFLHKNEQKMEQNQSNIVQIEPNIVQSKSNIEQSQSNIVQNQSNIEQSQPSIEQSEHIPSYHDNLFSESNRKTVEVVKQDIQRFVKQLDNSKDKNERIEVLIDGKHRLNGEAKTLQAEVDAELKELLYAKEIAVKLNNLVLAYEKKLTKNNMSQLKLADIITIKELLRNKLQREIQGFRTSQTEYKELEIVNPDDITKVIEDIKLKLGE